MITSEGTVLSNDEELGRNFIDFKHEEENLRTDGRVEEAARIKEAI